MFLIFDKPWTFLWWVIWIFQGSLDSTFRKLRFTCCMQGFYCAVNLNVLQVTIGQVCFQVFSESCCIWNCSNLMLQQIITIVSTQVLCPKVEKRMGRNFLAKVRWRQTDIWCLVQPTSYQKSRWRVWERICSNEELTPRVHLDRLPR